MGELPASTGHWGTGDSGDGSKLESLSELIDGLAPNGKLIRPSL